MITTIEADCILALAHLEIGVVGVGVVVVVVVVLRTDGDIARMARKRFRIQ